MCRYYNIASNIVNDTVIDHAVRNLLVLQNCDIT